MKASSLFLIFILLVMVFTAGMSLSFGNYEALLAPLLLSVAILVLGVIELVKELKSADAKGESTGRAATDEGRERAELRRFGGAFGWIAGFAFGIYLFGFFVSTLLFALSYLKVRGTKWPLSTVFAVGFTALLYVVFELGFKSHLYRGLVFGG